MVAGSFAWKTQTVKQIRLILWYIHSKRLSLKYLETGVTDKWLSLTIATRIWIIFISLLLFDLVFRFFCLLVKKHFFHFFQNVLRCLLWNIKLKFLFRWQKWTASIPTFYTNSIIQRGLHNLLVKHLLVKGEKSRMFI